MSSDSLEPAGLPMFKAGEGSRSRRGRNKTKRKEKKKAEPGLTPQREVTTESLIIPDGMEIEAVQQEITSEGRNKFVYKFKPKITDTNDEEIKILISLYDSFFGEMLLPFLEFHPEFEKEFEESLAKLIIE